LNKQYGFTLIEVLIASLILAGGIIVLSAAWSGSLMRLRKARLNSEVVVLLQQKMTEMELEFKNEPLDSVDESLSGDFGSEYPQYRWTFKTRELELPDLRALLVSRDEGADQLLLEIIDKTTQYIEQSVKEITVTVHVKKGTRELSYSLTSYLVDYDKQIALGGGLSCESDLSDTA